MLFETGFKLKGPLVIGKPSKKNKTPKRKTADELTKENTSTNAAPSEATNNTTKARPAQEKNPSKKPRTSEADGEASVKTKTQESAKNTKPKSEQSKKPLNNSKPKIKETPRKEEKFSQEQDKEMNKDGNNSEYDTDDWEDMKFSDEEDGEFEDMNLEEIVKPFTVKKAKKTAKKQCTESDDEVDFNSVLENFEAIKKQFSSVKSEEKKSNNTDKKVEDVKESPENGNVSMTLPSKKLSLKEQNKLKKLLEKKADNKLTVESGSKDEDIISSKHATLTPLQQRMQKKLQGARFRWINEQLYTTSGSKAFELLQKEPGIFEEYHEGFRSQAESWSVNPIDIYIDYVNSLPEDKVIADLGCGEAKLAASVKQKVWSFDLVAANDRITACDIANVPLDADTVDVAIFSLSLMGTNFLEFLIEAHRILKAGGQLKIAEVISRFTDIDGFIDTVVALGFRLEKKKQLSKMFIMFDFVKNSTSKQKKVSTRTPSAETTSHLLKPCIYKKR